MKEIGGYIELETFDGNMLHEGAVALNCGRGALEYICKAKNIKKLYIPYFLCSSVPDLCDRISVEYEYYHIDRSFQPVFNKTLNNGEWLYMVNFYGQIDNKTLSDWKSKYNNFIVDNAQSYYQMPVDGVDTLYTCRKYFGVADGAFLYTDKSIGRELDVDESYERMHFLLGRYERSANEFYSEYVANNKLFASEPVKRMSKLTLNLLHGIDYDAIAKQRRNNFEILNSEFKYINQLRVKSVYGAFMYPLLINNGSDVRKKLQAMKIYIPTLWPNVLETCSSDTLEYHYAADILPLPVDQRYGSEDMMYIVEAVKNVLSERA